MIESFRRRLTRIIHKERSELHESAMDKGTVSGKPSRQKSRQAKKTNLLVLLSCIKFHEFFGLNNKNYTYYG